MMDNIVSNERKPLRDRLYDELIRLQPDHPDYWNTILEHIMPIVEDEISETARRCNRVSGKTRQPKEGQS